jgi:FlaA1/EpsC-like NDP-sugar epimerase
MGASKRIAEKYIQSMFYSSQSGNRTTKFITARLELVLDPNCFVIQLFNRQIANGGPITITHPKRQLFYGLGSMSIDS